jgi:hypothetical protein
MLGPFPSSLSMKDRTYLSYAVSRIFIAIISAGSASTASSTSTAAPSLRMLSVVAFDSSARLNRLVGAGTAYMTFCDDLVECAVHGSRSGWTQNMPRSRGFPMVMGSNVCCEV